MLKILNDRGIALIMVLWILMLLTIIVSEFCYTMKTQVNITRNLKETTDAHYIAVAGFNKAVEQIIQQMLFPVTVDKAAGEESSADDKENETRWRVNTQIPKTAYGDGEYTVWLDNESGKININLADGDILRLMLAGFNLEEPEKDTIVDSIMDWRDSDDLHRTNGAENDYYLSLPNPYECKNGDFDSIEELLLVKGVTPEIFYGGLDHMVTVVPGRKAITIAMNQNPAMTQFNYNKLNINAIPARLWAAFPGMTQEALDQIIEFRKKENFISPDQVAEIVGIEAYDGIAKYLTVAQTPYFTIHSTGTVYNSSICESIEAVVCVTNRLKKMYQVVQWNEGPLKGEQFAARRMIQNEPSIKG